MASVGQVYYDVLPNLDKFASQVASGLSNAKPVKIPVQADTKSAEVSAKKLTQTQQREAEKASRQRMALIQRDAIAENRFRDKAAANNVRIAQRQAREEAKAAAVLTRATERDVAARKATIQSIGSGLAVAGAATLVGLAGVTKVTADFDAAVSNVKSTGDDAAASIGRLREEAIKYGADTAFSATEAANAQAELIKANVSVTDTINGGLKGALDLAAAGSLGVADAAGIMGTAMSQFNIPGTEASHVADLLAAGAGKAQGEVTDFAEALKYIGPIAATAGVSIEETTGVIAELANQGILGSQAGTSLRGILLSLTAPAGAGAKAMKEYGINVRDASGNFIGFEGAAGELQKRLGGLGQAERDAALARIFGKNSITAATILYEGGAEGVAKWTDAVNDSGFASEMAATKMDNLKGDVEQLKGALDSAFINSGGGGTAFLRDLAQGATAAIDGFNSLPASVQKGTFQVAAVAGAAALAVGGFIKLTGAIAAVRTGLLTLGPAGAVAAGGLKAATAAALPAAAAFAAVAVGGAVFDKLGTQSKSLGELETALAGIAKGSNDLNSVFSGANWADQLQGLLSNGITPAKDLQSALKGLEVTQESSLGKFQRWRETITPGTQSLEKAEQQVGALDGALASMVGKGAGDQAAAALKNLGVSSEQVARFFPQYAEALKTAGTAGTQAAAGGTAAAAGTQQAGEAAAAAAEQQKAMNDALYATANAALAASGNIIGVEAAMDAARDAVKANGETLDLNTAKGRANQQALDSLASATLNATQAMVENGDSAQSIVAINERAKNSWVDQARAMGMSAGEARDMADSLFAIPESVKSQVVVSGANVSRKQAQDLNQALKGIPKEQRARIVTIANTKGAKEAQREIAKVKNKSVIAKATGKGVNTVREIDGAIKKLKSKTVRAQANSAGKPAVNALDKAVKALKDRRVKASATTSGKSSVDALRGSVSSLSSKTITITTRRITKEQVIKGGADGMLVPPVRRAGGGPITGSGGPREDNIMGIDRATGLQSSWVSAGEFVVNALQTQRNRAQIETLNRGGKWDLIPRRAAGGSDTATVAGTGLAGRSRQSITLNLDMGDLGVRRIVTEILEDQNEYSASVGRMN